MKKKLLVGLGLLLSISAYSYDIEVDGIYYNINTKDYESVRVVSGDNPYIGCLHIPDTVSYGEKKFVVIGIDEMKNCSLDSLIIEPNNYHQFGFREGSLTGTTVRHFVIHGGKDNEHYPTVSFSSFPKGLESMTIEKVLWFTSIYKSQIVGKQESLKEITIGNGADNISDDPFFDNCENVERVISLIEEPSDIHINMFSTKTYLNATLYVPKGTKERYAACQGWSNFFNITDEDVPTNIGTAKVKSDSECYYDLWGRKQTYSQKGITIVRFPDGTVRKIYK